MKVIPATKQSAEKKLNIIHIVTKLPQNMQNRFIWNIIEFDRNIFTDNKVVNNILIGGGGVRGAGDT